jgi:hypothetical protein
MESNTKKKPSFFYRNSLSLILLFLFIIFLGAQSFTGWKEYNDQMEEKGGQIVNYKNYLTTSHFSEATFENWESEFLQMALYVMLTIFLRQKGSSESKSMDEEEEVDKEPQPHPSAPWPVKRGGLWLKIYKHSLTITFFLLFMVSFVLHAYSSLDEHNEELMLKGEPTENMSKYIVSSKLWFESFQNWQSEFLAVFSIVVLSIFLRQKGSPESKPVDAPYSQTGS